MLIKTYRDMVLTYQGFHLKEEQYRQFLETVYRQYPQYIFFLIEICLVRKMKMHENEGGGLTQMLIKPYRDMILTNQGFRMKEEQYRNFLELVYRQYLQYIFFLFAICLVLKMKMHENEWGGSHSDANKILQRHTIERSSVSFERRMIKAVFSNHIGTISQTYFFLLKKRLVLKNENAGK